MNQLGDRCHCRRRRRRRRSRCRRRRRRRCCRRRRSRRLQTATKTTKNLSKWSSTMFLVTSSSLKNSSPDLRLYLLEELILLKYKLINNIVGAQSGDSAKWR